MIHLSTVTYHGNALASSTINGYISHVISKLKDKRLIDNSFEWRTERMAMYMAGFRRRDAGERAESRRFVKIDVSLPITIEAMATARAKFAHDPLLAETVANSMLFGLSFATRPGDYLYPHVKYYTDSNNCIRAEQVAFWFPSLEDPIPITHPEDFPPGEWPSYCTFRPLFDKANQYGGMGMRAIAANPNVDKTGHCSLRLLFAYFIKYPPSDGMPIFHTAPREFHLYERVSEVLKETAVRLKLDPTRLLPHGLRAGVITQLNSGAHSDEDKKAAGGWRTMPGKMPYEKDTQAIGRADRTAVAMNNIKSVSIAVVRHAFTAVNPGPKRGFGGASYTRGWSTHR